MAVIHSNRSVRDEPGSESTDEDVQIGEETPKEEKELEEVVSDERVPQPGVDGFARLRRVTRLLVRTEA